MQQHNKKSSKRLTNANNIFLRTNNQSYNPFKINLNHSFKSCKKKKQILLSKSTKHLNRIFKSSEPRKQLIKEDWIELRHGLMTHTKFNRNLIETKF